MTKAQLYTFVSSILGGIEIDTTLFSNFLDIAQMQVEGVRPWVKLRSSNSSLSASAATQFTTQFALATDFREWYDEDASIQLLDSSNNPMMLTEVPFDRRYQYKSASARFTVDYANNVFYLLGTLTQSYTILQSYIKIPTLVSEDDGNSWTFPERFHKILGLFVAAMWRHGVDYDLFNNPMADKQVTQALVMIDIMTRWDATLQASMQRGIDPFGYAGMNGLPNGTNIQ